LAARLCSDPLGLTALPVPIRAVGLKRSMGEWSGKERGRGGRRKGEQKKWKINPLGNPSYANTSH